jgi:hypothetical protein
MKHSRFSGDPAIFLKTLKRVSKSSIQITENISNLNHFDNIQIIKNSPNNQLYPNNQKIIKIS